MSKVLIVDDQAPVRTALEMLFGELHGIPTLSASRPEEVLDLVASEDVGVVIQDMNFRPEDTDGGAGAALFRAIRKLDPELPVVLVTAFTSLPTAVALIKEGASDYIAKPWDNDRLVLTVTNLLRMRELGQENRRLLAQSGRAREALAARADLCGLVYKSQAVHEVVTRTHRDQRGAHPRRRRGVARRRRAGHQPAGAVPAHAAPRHRARATHAVSAPKTRARGESPGTPDAPPARGVARESCGALPEVCQGTPDPASSLSPR